MYAGYEPSALGFLYKVNPPPHWCDLGRIPCRQSSPREQPPKEVRVQLHRKESLIDGDETDDVQHPHRIKVLQLQTPLIEEPTQELVRGVS